MIKLLIISICILLYKFTRNFVAHRKLLRYKQVYSEWSENPTVNFAQYAMEVVNLFKRASIPNASVYLDANALDPAITFHMITKFDCAIGVYESRMKETFCPIYWLDLIIFAPKKIISMLGFDINKSAAKLCNLLLTALWWLILFFFNVFREPIKSIIFDWLEHHM